MKKRCFALILSLMLAASALAEGTTYTATGDDESALDVSGTEQLTLSGVTVQKTGGSASSADAASFRGVNAAVRVYDSAVLTISDSTITATAPNATGVFAYDQGTVYISDCQVSVTGGGAGGVQVAGGGTLIGSNLTVTSASKAAIRSDRGGGTLILEGGSYTSTGKNGCPAIYSTADITVKDAVCVSEQSRAVIIEGKNTVTLENATIEGNDQSTKEGSVKANVLLYQSASGDASVGTSVFTMRQHPPDRLRRALGQGGPQRRRLRAERPGSGFGGRHHRGRHFLPRPPSGKFRLYRRDQSYGPGRNSVRDPG